MSGVPDLDDLRPRRSVLYMPAANERALEKAKTIPADALIFDLEDAVAPDAKPSARVQACAAARSGAYRRREIVAFRDMQSTDRTMRTMAAKQRRQDLP